MADELEFKRKAFRALGQATPEEMDMIKDGAQNPLVLRMMAAHVGLRYLHHENVTSWRDEARGHLGDWYPDLSPELVEMTLTAAKVRVTHEMESADDQA